MEGGDPKVENSERTRTTPSMLLKMEIVWWVFQTESVTNPREPSTCQKIDRS